MRVPSGVGLARGASLCDELGQGLLRDLMYQRGARVGLIPGRFVAQEGSLLDEAKRLV